MLETLFVLLITGGSGAHGRMLSTDLIFKDQVSCEQAGANIMKVSAETRNYPYIYTMCVPVKNLSKR